MEKSSSGVLPSFSSFSQLKQRQSATLAKNASLGMLVLQNTSMILSMRYSRVTPASDGRLYLSSSAIFMGEVLKFVVCLVVVFSSPRPTKQLYDNLVINFRDTVKVAVPALLYTMQSNLLFMAAGKLDSATYAVTCQLKILTTALFSVLLLGKILHRFQWISLLCLTIGVALVQLPEKLSVDEKRDLSDNFYGIFYVLLASTSSGFAGVYFEKILKGSVVSVWMRNIQLGLFTGPISFVMMYGMDGSKIQDYGIFQGYNNVVLFVILNQAVGGLLVSFVVKYADNILKGYASSLSIILSAILSIYLFDFHVTFAFTFGTLFVIAAVYLYSLPPPSK